MSRSAELKELVMWNRLQAVADEQASTLMRTAFSPIVRESGDLSAGVFDIDGRMLTQAVTGTPGHVNSMAAAVTNFFDYFPRQAMRPGDLYLSNDPWLGSGHLNDFVLVRPCFMDETLVGFVSCTSHLIDIGGQCMGPDGSDVYDEGLYIPPIRLLDGGELDATLVTLLRANSRIPDESEGDLYALIACSEVGEQRLIHMMREFGQTDLDSLSRVILETSERATRKRIAALPDGVYENEMLTDGYDFEVRLKAALTIEGDELTIDFSGTSGLSRHGINVPFNYATAYTVFGIKCAVAPDIPNNAGALAPFKVTAPKGVIVRAPKPAPVCSRHVIGQLLPDVALGCLHQALAAGAPAEGASTLWDFPMRDAIAPGSPGTPFAIELVHNGGTGARPGQDGLSATAYPSGVMGSLVEITETVAPLLIESRELRPDSGGPGRFRGGLGQVITMRSSEGVPITLFATVDRIKHPARGREGGLRGAAGISKLASGATLNGKGAQTVPPGETLVMMTPGGGGYGSPFERDPARVADDVRNALVGVAAAAERYGVVLDEAGGVNEAATRERRARPRPASAARPGATGMAPKPRATIADLGIYPAGEASLPGTERIVDLAQNESSATPSEAVLEAYRAAGPGLNRYGAVGASTLRERLAELHDLDADRIVCGAGSGELICLLANAYAETGGEVLVDQHAYLFFRTAARIAGARPVIVRHEGLGFDPEATLAAVTERTRIVFVDNPANPIGTLVDRETLARFRAALRDDVLLVIDAAYAEYCLDPDYDGGVSLVDETDNTVMLRTFSKIYALAGARLGWAYCPGAIAHVLNRVRTPDNVSSPAVAAGLAAIGERQRAAALRAENARLRALCGEHLAALGLEPYPSHGCFVLVRFPDEQRSAGAAFDYLRSRGILVRRMAPYGLVDHLRITIGSEDDTRAVLDALRAFMS